MIIELKVINLCEPHNCSNIKLLSNPAIFVKKNELIIIIMAFFFLNIIVLLHLFKQLIMFLIIFFSFYTTIWKLLAHFHST